MRILILLLAMCLPVHAAYIKYLATNVFYELDTNQVIVRPIGSPINANGTFVTRGPSFRLSPDQSTNVQAGNYIITNATLGTNIFFAVPTDSTTNIYLIGDLAISGYNTYNYTPGVRTLTAGDNITLSGITGNITISSSGGGTSGALTNNDTRQVTLNDRLTIGSGATDGRIILTDGEAKSYTAIVGDSGWQFSQPIEANGSLLTALAGANITSGTITSNKLDATAYVAFKNDLTAAGLAAGSYAISATNANFYIQGDPSPMFTTATNTVVTLYANTNTVYISGAGTSADNGTYTLLGRDASREVWYKSGPIYIVHEIGGAGVLEDAQWILGASTNTSATLDEDYINGTSNPTTAWEVAAGVAPAPTFSYATNYTTNLFAYLSLSNSILSFGAGGVFGNVYYVSQFGGSDTLGQKGKFPFLSLAGALTNANREAAVFFVDAGTYTNAVTLSPGQVVIGRGNSTVFRYAIGVTNNNAIYNCKFEFVSGTADSSININGAATNIYLENIFIDGGIDALYAISGSTTEPFVVQGKSKNCRFGSGWDAVIFQSFAPSNYINWEFENDSFYPKFSTNKITAYGGFTPGVSPMGTDFIGVHGLTFVAAGTNNQADFILRDCYFDVLGSHGTNNVAIGANGATNRIVLINTSIQNAFNGVSGSSQNFQALGGGTNSISNLASNYFSGSIFATGGISATNGIASLATTTAASIAATGWTNIWSTNAAIVYYTASSATVVTVKNRANTTLYTTPSQTIMTTIYLQPGWGFSASGNLSGTAVPF